MLALLLAGSLSITPATYLESLEQYRRGQGAEAIRAEWPARWVRGEAPKLAAGPSFPYELAVMLHTDRELARRGTGRQVAGADLEAALSILYRMPAAGRAVFERRWRFALAVELHVRMDWDGALSVLDGWLGRVPDDADALLEKGTILAVVSDVARHSLRWAEGAEPRQDVAERAGLAVGEVRRQMIDAADCFRRALMARPESIEARLRLARALQVLGRDADALTELRAVLAAADASRSQRYLAHLFLGRSSERAGRLPEARVEYEAALQLDPEAQAAAVALSHVSHREGQRAAAQATLERGLAREGARSSLDPWWQYPWGRADEADGLLAELRSEARR
jgi:tetratricopeptide (TPR) repeat protein